MLVDNPLLHREMQALRRARWQRLTLRLTWILFTLVFLCCALPPVWSHIPEIVALLLGWLAVLVLLRATLGGATCIVRERERQTWDALVLTRLRAHEIVAGKALPVLATALLPGVAAVPFIFILVWTSGLPAITTCAVLAWVIMLAVGCTAITVRVSATSRQSTEALVGAGLLALFSVALLAILALLATEVYGVNAGVRALGHGSGLVLAAAVSALCFVRAAEAIPGNSWSYHAPARASGAVAYLAALVLGWMHIEVSRAYSDLSYSMLNGSLGANILVCAFAGAVACARAEPLRERPGSLRALSSTPVNGWSTSLAHWLVLYVIGLACVAVVSLVGEIINIPSICNEADSIMLLWVGAAGACAVSICAGFGCLVAQCFSQFKAGMRAAMALMAPWIMISSAIHNFPITLGASAWVGILPFGLFEEVAIHGVWLGPGAVVAGRHAALALVLQGAFAAVMLVLPFAAIGAHAPLRGHHRE